MSKYIFFEKLKKNWVISFLVISTLIVSNSLSIFNNFEPANAADLSKFQAGNIISDSLFYDGNALNSAQVQSFLNSKVPSCTINNGQASHAAGAPYGSTSISDVCLKSYSQPTPTMAAQPGICSAYQGSANESAAQIIAKVGRACNISQKVILVLLEKEQSLISDSWPTVRQISQATGFACYDNGQPCVQEFAGFFYQVWSAARQFQRYGNSPFTWYPVGQTSNILFQANKPECGTKPVFIQNRATAALYYYTPYTPNEAALRAGYGLGDACSAYGNRNFFQLYEDWFGSTLGEPWSVDIENSYQSLGGQQGFLGTPTSDVMCGLKDGGCWKRFTGGLIFWNPTFGTKVVKNSIRPGWEAAGNENGALGYPISDTLCGLVADGCWQRFEGGFVFASLNGSHFVLPQIREAWSRFSNENGPLGYPKSNTACGLRSSGCFQAFDGGYVFTSAVGGTRVVKPEVRSLWNTLSNENGVLGYPTSDPSNNTATYTQTFEGGTITVTNGVARVTSSNDPWINAVVSNSWLGTNITPKICGLRSSGCFQAFDGGYVFTSAVGGTRVVKPEVRSLWNTLRNENGVLGYPTSDPSNNTATYTQTFEGGTITVTNGVARVTSSNDPWINAVVSNSWLGTNITPKICGLRSSGCFQAFDGGYVFTSAVGGTRVVKPEVRSLWNTLSNENGVLGYPTSDPSNNTATYTQTFEGGTITVTNGVARVTSSNDPWINAVVSNSWLGTNITPKICGLRSSGCFQAFDGGYVFTSAVGGTRVVKPEVRSLWNTLRNENGVLGYPTSDPSNNTATYTQTFEGGTITVTNGVARVTSSNDPWINAVVSNSWLGTNITPKICGLRSSGCFQAFDGGYVFTSAVGGTRVVKPEVRSLWNTLSNENGVLGYPTSDPSNNTATYTQTFEGGTITVTNGVARVTSSNDPWINAVVSNSWLGTNITPKICGLRSSGCFQAFDGGYVFTSAVGGTRVVKPEVRSLWNTLRNENGVLGYPTSDPSNNTATYTQTFEGGTITVTNGVARRN